MWYQQFLLCDFFNKNQKLYAKRVIVDIKCIHPPCYLYNKNNNKTNKNPDFDKSIILDLTRTLTTKVPLSQNCWSIQPRWQGSCSMLGKN